MLQFFSEFRRPAAARRGLNDEFRRWRVDPLSHPDLQRMSERELADLPLRTFPNPERVR